MAGRKSAVYGDLTKPNGTSVPVLLETPSAFNRSGIDIQSLDPIIGELLQNADAGANLVNQCAPMLRELMGKLQGELNTAMEAIVPTTYDGEAPAGPSPALIMYMDIVNRVVIILDRLNKMTLNSVKSKDTAVRLRSFLTTGDEDDGGIDALGETELRRMVNIAARGFKPDDAV